MCVLVNETAVLPSVVVMWQCLECVLKCDKTAVFSNVWWLCGLYKGARARCSEKESSIHIKNGGGGVDVGPQGTDEDEEEEKKETQAPYVSRMEEEE